MGCVRMSTAGEPIDLAGLEQRANLVGTEAAQLLDEKPAPFFGDERVRFTVADPDFAAGRVGRLLAIERLLLGLAVSMLDEHSEQRERVEVRALAESFVAGRKRGDGMIELVPGPALLEVLARHNHGLRQPNLHQPDIATLAGLALSGRQVRGAALTPHVDGKDWHGVEPERPEQAGCDDRGEHLAVARSILGVPVFDAQDMTVV